MAAPSQSECLFLTVSRKVAMLAWALFLLIATGMCFVVRLSILNNFSNRSIPFV